MSESFLQARRFFSVCMSCWGWWRQWLHQKYGRLPAMDCGRQTHFPQVGVWGNIFQYVSARFNSFFAHLTLQQNITLWSTHCASGASPGTWGLLVIGLNFQRPGRPGLSCPASHRCPPMPTDAPSVSTKDTKCKDMQSATQRNISHRWNLLRDVQILRAAISAHVKCDYTILYVLRYVVLSYWIRFGTFFVSQPNNAKTAMGRKLFR
jgi:hypothetical protein